MDIWMATRQINSEIFVMIMKIKGVHFHQEQETQYLLKHVRAPIFLSISIFVQSVFGWCSRRIQSWVFFCYCCFGCRFLWCMHICILFWPMCSSAGGHSDYNDWTCHHWMSAPSCFILSFCCSREIVSLLYVFLTVVLIGPESHDLIIVFKFMNLIKNRRTIWLFSHVSSLLPRSLPATFTTSMILKCLITTV